MAYDGSSWRENATEMDPKLLALARKFAHKVKGKGGAIIKPKSEEERGIELDRAHKRLGFKLYHTSVPRRRR